MFSLTRLVNRRAWQERVPQAAGGLTITCPLAPEIAHTVPNTPHRFAANAAGARRR